MSDEETTEQARRRWLKEESGPGGILSEEGISGGGIFGSQAIATPRSDPESRARSDQGRVWRALAGRLERRAELLAEDNAQLRQELAEQKRLLEGKRPPEEDE